jgi:hypothetical protein
MKAKNTTGASGQQKTLFGTNQQNLLALVKASPLGIIAIDLDGYIVMENGKLGALERSDVRFGGLYDSVGISREYLRS